VEPKVILRSQVGAINQPQQLDRKFSQFIQKFLVDLIGNSDDIKDNRQVDSWLSEEVRTVEKKCANLFDEGCINHHLPSSNRDEVWLQGPYNPGK